MSQDHEVKYHKTLIRAIMKIVEQALKIKNYTKISMKVILRKSWLKLLSMVQKSEALFGVQQNVCYKSFDMLFTISFFFPYIYLHIFVIIMLKTQPEEKFSFSGQNLSWSPFCMAPSLTLGLCTLPSLPGMDCSHAFRFVKKKISDMVCRKCIVFFRRN